MMGSLRPERWSASRLWLFGGLLSAVVVGGFLLVSGQMRGPGFPLDDAWIHQTYARNLAQGLGWVYQPGQPSGGSTSPLWTLLLVPGQLLGLAPVAWVAVVGAAGLVGLALSVRGWLMRGYGLPVGFATVAGLASILEWHLVWAALSGMETLLAALLPVAFLWQLSARKSRPLLLGALVGLGVWIRPDLLSLAVAAGWVWTFGQGRGARSARWLMRFSIGLLAAALPYLLLQEALSGRPWPSTLYAKQAEYAVLRAAPLGDRLLAQYATPLVGGLALLSPGIAYWLVSAIRRRRWEELAPFMWTVAYAAAFAVRLPVTYQHGRYSIPLIPVLLGLGAVGYQRAKQEWDDRSWMWVLSRAWVGSAVLVGLAFLWIGARAYATDVAIIESEMVQTADWLRQNTPSNALVAAHDIGAIGYFSDRRILDLAGLINPEVIPILRNESALASLLDERQAAYLVTFPSWYPDLVERARRIHVTGGTYAPAAGGENMAVYRWGD